MIVDPSTIDAAKRQADRLDAESGVEPGRAHRVQLGQFPTPDPIASLMASFLASSGRSSFRILDAGAGTGTLGASLVRRLIDEEESPGRIDLTVYEIDPELVPSLRATLAECRQRCERAGVRYRDDLRGVDFVADAVRSLRGDLFATRFEPFDLAIVNPPYRKIRADSQHRILLRSVGIETGNLYTAFLALICRLLRPGGQVVAIVPRSFCNGPYFRSFRAEFLETMRLRRMHLFDSRTAAFVADDVLQENVIVHAEKSGGPPGKVVVSSSSGDPDGPVRRREVPYSEVIVPGDRELFIHLVIDAREDEARSAMRGLGTSLRDLGLTVSTGRVVDFRVDAHLRASPGPGTAPLIYPCHFEAGHVRWPREGGRKPNAMVVNAETCPLLVPSEPYVLVKRFTSKEERRRLVAVVYDPARVPSETVGFENHLNYFHRSGRGLPMDLARGLAMFLNSTPLDVYFRQFNGHTQVNATDLRNISYPTREQLLRMGQGPADSVLGQAEIDARVEEAIGDRS